MTIYEIKDKKALLKGDIHKLLQDFQKETGMRFDKDNTIKTLYNSEGIDNYSIELKTLNPF